MQTIFVHKGISFKICSECEHKFQLQYTWGMTALYVENIVCSLHFTNTLSRGIASNVASHSFDKHRTYLTNSL